MRLLCAAAVSLTLGLLLAFSDDKKPTDTKDTKTARAEKFKTIEKKFNTEMDDFKKRFKNSKSESEQRGIRAEARELAVLTTRDVLKLAEEDPKDEVAFDSAVFVLKTGIAFGAEKEVESASAIIAEHHLNTQKFNDQAKELIDIAAEAGQGGQKLLLAIADKGKDKDLKAKAYFFLGMGISEQLEDVEDDKKMDELIAKAADYFKKAVQESPDTKVGESTIAKESESQIESFRAIKNLAVGKTAPDAEGTNLEGKKIKLSSYKGNVVLLDIWATWCGPCRSMIPHEREMVKKMEKDKKPFKLVSVSCDTEQDTLVKFFEKEPMPWDHWFDGARGAVAKTFRVRAFPTLYLIDHTGVIRHKWVGVPNDEELENAIKKLVDAANKAKG